jgi:hypothetical protein
MIDKLTPRYLNLDDDVRLIKTIEMTDAINVRISSEQDGDGGVIKNAYGNSSVPFAVGSELPSGDNQVIGAVSNPQGGEIFFFVWNSNNDHTIYRFSTSSNEAKIIYRDPVLSFSKFYHVRASVVKNLAGETLLYFTDANTDPKKINVTRALLGLYPSAFTSGTDQEKLACIAIAKQPPMTPPTFTFSTNPALKQNNLYESTFQFAAQYVYNDGERSALSPYSELAVAQNQFLDGIISEEQKLANNTLSISVPTSSADVKEIIVLVRNGNAGAFYEIGVLVNSNLVSSQSISFDNSKLYSAVSQDEVNKIYDNVPQTAESLTIAGNRLMLGGYTEGYPNIRTDVDVLPNYYKESLEYNIDVVYPSKNVVVPSDPFVARRIFDLDVSSIPSVVTEDAILNISFALNLGRVKLNIGGYYIQWVQTDKISKQDRDYAGLINYDANPSAESNGINVMSSPLSISKTVNVPAGSTKQQVLDLITNEVADSYNLILDSDVTDFSYATQITEVKDLQGSSNNNKWMFFNGSAQARTQVSAASTLNTLSFGISIDNAILTAKEGYNFNVATSVLGPLVNIFGIKALITRSKSVGEAFPATNALFNKINFVDLPSVSFNGTGSTYTRYTSISKNLVNGFTPGGGIVSTASNLFLTGEDDDEKAISYSAAFLSNGNINSYPSFKAGATHSFGIVYYDQFNRNGGVQELSSSYSKWYNERFSENNLYGRVSNVLRIKHTAPSWAVKWAPVIASSSSITNKVQYSIARAYVSSNLQAKEFNALTTTENITFLSLRTLEGKSDSYKDQYGANLEYVFQKGDRIRVINFSKRNLKYTFNVTSISGAINVGDTLVQFGISGGAFLSVSEVNLIGGSGTIVARLFDGSVIPSASGTLIDLFTGGSAVYTSYSVSDFLMYDVEIDTEVLGYFDFVDDISSNPVLDLSSDEATFNTTGKFLAVYSSNQSGWSNYEVAYGQDNWRKDCIIEIYRQNKSSDVQVFYEVGENFPVVNGVHVGQRNVISQYNVSVVNAFDRGNLLVYSDVKPYKGDILIDGSGNSMTVGNVYPEPNGIYSYVFYASTTSGSFTATTYTLNLTNSNDAVVELVNGDCYYRPRMLKFGEKAYSNNFTFTFIEDYSVSDFFTSKATSIGRPHAVQPDAKTVFRRGSVTYSDPFVIDSKYLGLSSFNPTLANFYDFEYLHGTIKQLVGDDDRVYVVQERKSGWAPVGRNIIESTNGVQSLTLSTNVIGVPNYYQGDYGINNNPESLAVDRGRIYFADIRSGKVIRISRDGITLISETKMDAFFKENFRYLTTLSSSNKVVAGIDVEADEYIISSELLYNATVTISTAGETYAEFNVQTNAVGDRVIADVEFDDDELFTFDTEIREFQDLCDEFQDSLNCIVFLDKLTDGQPAYVGEEFIGQSGVIYGVATDTSYSFFVTIAFDLATGEFYFTNDCGDYSGSIGSPSDLVNDFTVAYDVEDKVWNTKYSYRPEAIVSVDDELYTFSGGTMYAHNSASNRATYYGQAYGSTIEVVGNSNPSMVKSYESISIEGNSPWATTLSNTDQIGSILVGDFSERERNWYAYVPRDSSVNVGSSTITKLTGTSEVFVLGSVATSGVSGSSITFTTPVGDIPFPIGGSLFKVSGSTLVALNLNVASISGLNQVTTSGTVINVTSGDTILVIGNGGIEGDTIRDYFVKARMHNDSTSNVELYAVNLVFAKSNLHNQLGQ